jgi:predicted dehydrogenase
MKFLIQGIGSIGQRHYKNAYSLGYEVAVLRSHKEERPFVREFFESQKKAGREPSVFYDLAEAVATFKPDALIVATPNHLHLSNALDGARLGLHLFIEKPLHNSTQEVAALIRMTKERQLVAMVGYNFRFHPLVIRVKEMLDRHELGDVLSASVEVGENIEDWHHWEDYRETYAPWVRSGGGSLLCFSHDIDCLYWFLGVPTHVTAAGGKITPLVGDAEDMVESLWRWPGGKTATLHIDYWQRPKVRTLKLIGTQKTILWDAYRSLVVWDHATGKEQTIDVPAGFERNEMFLSELTHFVECIEQKKEPLITFAQGAEVVAIIERMKCEFAKNV